MGFKNSTTLFYIKHIHFTKKWFNWSQITPRNKTILKLFFITLLLVAIPLTVTISQKQQNISQKAAAPDQLEAEGGVLGGNATVIADTNASGGHFVLFAASAPPPTPTPIPTPTSTPNSQKIVQFPATGTQAQFTALLTDMTIDVIEIGTPNATTTYSNWNGVYWSTDRSARPLLIRPAPGATVIWNGNGGSGDGLFYPGWNGKAAFYTFDPAGTGGSFHINNFNLTQTGLVSTAYVANVTFNGFQTSGNIAPSTNGCTAWSVYVSSDGTHRGKNITANNWIVDNTTSTSGHYVNGFQTEHDPQADGVTVNNWTVTGGYWGLVGRLSTSGLNVSGWNITGTSGPSFDSEGPSGVVKNMHTTNSGAPIIQSPMVDGGGNTWTSTPDHPQCQ